MDTPGSLESVPGLTMETYKRQDPKRVYYISMEYLAACFLDSMATLQLPAHTPPRGLYSYDN